MINWTYLIHLILIGIESLILMTKLSIKITIKWKAHAKNKADQKKEFELWKEWKKVIGNKNNETIENENKNINGKDAK